MSDFDKNDANTGGKNSEPDVDAAHEAAMAYDGIDDDLRDKLVEWRRHLHTNPELSYEEKATTDYVAEQLEGLGFEVRRFSVGTGLICDVPAADDATADDLVALRADIDALRVVSEGINRLRSPERATLLITHYQRLLDYIKPDRVHVLAAGRIVASGGPELAQELEREGYAAVAA